MTLFAFIQMLNKIVEEEPDTAAMPVFYRHGASGDCGPLGSAKVTTEVTDEGPFDLDDGEYYISIYAGN